MDILHLDRIPGEVPFKRDKEAAVCYRVPVNPLGSWGEGEGGRLVRTAAKSPPLRSDVTS